MMTEVIRNTSIAFFTQRGLLRVGLLRKACLTKLTPQGAKDLIVFGQCFHLMPETPVPQCHQTSIFCEDAVFDAFGRKTLLACASVKSRSSEKR